MNKKLFIVLVSFVIVSVGLSSLALYKSDSPIRVNGTLSLEDSQLFVPSGDGLVGGMIAPIFYKLVGSGNRALVPTSAVYDWAWGSTTASSSAPFSINIDGDDADGTASGSWTFANITVTGTCTGCAGSAAGSDTQIIFNDGGAYAGDAQFLWNKTSNLLTITGGLLSTNASVSSVFELGDTGFRAAAGVLTGITSLTGDYGLFTNASISGTFELNTVAPIKGEKKCFTYAFEAPTTTENWGSKFFPDAFTITSVTAIASGSNAVGWNILHGTAGSITTGLFSSAKSASSSAVGSYSAFNDATLAANEYTQLQIASASATIENLDITICGNH